MPLVADNFIIRQTFYLRPVSVTAFSSAVVVFFVVRQG